ncbi:hypothetical protein FRC03_010592 [Tulasnella sp. 419]|nr:hypothetical protein FRC03_010592 [Tulasnella sp. 419]
MSSSDNSIEVCLLKPFSQLAAVVKHVQAIQLAGGSEGYQQSIQQAKPEIQESDIDFKYKIGISIDFPTLPIQIITVKVDNGWSAAGWASGFNSSAVPHYPFRAELKYNDWDTLTSGRCSWLIRPHLIGGLQLVIVRGDALVLGAVDLPFDRSDSGLQGAYGGLTWSPPKVGSLIFLEGFFSYCYCLRRRMIPLSRLQFLTRLNLLGELQDIRKLSLYPMRTSPPLR